MSPNSYTEPLLVRQTTAECLSRKGLDLPEMCHVRHWNSMKPIEFTEKAQWASGNLT